MTFIHERAWCPLLRFEDLKVLFDSAEYVFIFHYQAASYSPYSTHSLLTGAIAVRWKYLTIKIFGFEAITSTMFLFNLQYPSRVWRERITAKTVELFYSLFFLLAKMAKNSMSRNANFKNIFLLALLKATVTVVGVTHGCIPYPEVN